MKREFNTWLATMKDSIATWKYYTDFEKVYQNVDQIKIELNILNSLVGSKNIEEDFRNLLTKYPEVLKVIPLLLAKRESEIKITDKNNEYIFNFTTVNYSIDEYVKFMRNTGLFDLISHRIINNLVDYVIGIEVGMDTNARKNRTGKAMEDLVESYIAEACKDVNATYHKEMNKSLIEEQYGIDLSLISNQGKTEKRFDFVIVHNNHIYAIEVNFYSGGGSKLNETARSYKTLAMEAKEIENFTFVWITDGNGWQSARRNLEETFDILDTVYNFNDLSNEVLSKLLKKEV